MRGGRPPVQGEGEPGPCIDDLSFRRAGPDDVPALALLDRQCFERTFYPETVFASYVATGQPTYLAETAGGELAAFAMLWLQPGGRMSTLVSLDVAHDWRRCGLGSALVGLCARGQLEEAAEPEGCAMALTVAVGNEGARRFYEALGFAEDRVLDGYYGDEDGLVMWTDDLPPLAALAPLAPLAPLAALP